MFLSIDINVNGLIQGKCRRKPIGLDRQSRVGLQNFEDPTS